MDPDLEGAEFLLMKNQNVTSSGFIIILGSYQTWCSKKHGVIFLVMFKDFLSCSAFCLGW